MVEKGRCEMNLEDRISIYTVMKVVVLLLVLIATLYPFIYMLSVSLSDNIYVIQNKVKLFPKGFNLNTYKVVFRDDRILQAYLNTILYVVLGTTISLSVTCAAAYALSKKNRLIFHSFFNMMIIITMFFSGGMIPTYLTVKALGLYNTIWAVVLPSAVSAWNLIVMKSFFANFPVEIEESGVIDGLNDIGILWYLVLPLSKAVLATIGLFYAVGQWNAFFGPFIYLKDQSKYPLQIILRDIVLLGSSFDLQVAGGSGDQLIIEESLKYATIIVSVAPIIAVYPFLQKYFVKGVLIGSIKG